MASLPHPITSPLSAVRSSTVRRRSLTLGCLLFVLLILVVSIKLIVDKSLHGAKRVQVKRQFQLGGALGGEWEQPVFKFFSEPHTTEEPMVEDAAPIAPQTALVSQTSSTLTSADTVVTLSTAFAQRSSSQVLSTDVPTGRITAWSEATSNSIPTSTLWTIGINVANENQGHLMSYQPSATGSLTDDNLTSGATITTLWDPVVPHSSTENGQLTTFLTSLTGTITTIGNLPASTSGLKIQTQQQDLLHSSTDVTTVNQQGQTRLKLGYVVIVAGAPTTVSTAGVHGKDRVIIQNQEETHPKPPKLVIPHGLMGKIMDGIRRVILSVKLKISPALP